MDGYLRRDEDGHWYFFPVHLLDKWLKIQEQELPDFYCHTGEDLESLYEKAMEEFEQYRLELSIQSYVWRRIE